MDLKTYLDDLPRGGATVLAAALGISPVYLAQLAARQGGREPSPELCMRFETATNLKVRAWDLRPHDWHRIWPMLIGNPDAPAPRPDDAEARAVKAA